MLAPRFCIKDGEVDWSRSPNAEDFPLAKERPFVGRLLTPGALRMVVLDHARWKRDPKRGRRADLRGAVVKGQARRLVEAKLSDPNAKQLWAEVMATAQTGK